MCIAVMKVELSAVLLMDIMQKAESIYRKNPNPQDLIPGLQHAQNVLTACVSSPALFQRFPWFSLVIQGI